MVGSIAANSTCPGAKKRRQRYYAYLAKDGTKVWFARAIHTMLLEHPTWLTNFHVERATGDSRLMTMDDYRTLRRNGFKPSP